MAINNDVNRLIFFGDSICVGQGVSIHKGWMTRIADRVESLAEPLHHSLCRSRRNIRRRVAT